MIVDKVKNVGADAVLPHGNDYYCFVIVFHYFLFGADARLKKNGDIFVSPGYEIDCYDFIIIH